MRKYCGYCGSKLGSNVKSSHEIENIEKDVELYLAGKLSKSILRDRLENLKKVITSDAELNEIKKIEKSLK